MNRPSHSFRYPLEEAFGRIFTPFERFLRRTTAGGIILIGTTLITLLIANSPWGVAFHHLWERSLALSLGNWRLEMTLHHWVNDGLMALFFLLVGLEIKREILVGELARPRDAVLPIVGAMGGLLVPPLIYSAFNAVGPAAAGWGIPMATDIAFAVGILVLLAWRIPHAILVFLAALAIVDDLGAVLVIALFYTEGIDTSALISGAVLLAVLVLLNRSGIRHPMPYALAGVFLWYFVLLSGLHATLSGILLAFCIPALPSSRPQQFDERLRDLGAAFRAEIRDPNGRDSPLSNERMAIIAAGVQEAALAVQAPLQRMEHGLNPWVGFLVIPLFALANAGIDFAAIDLGQSITAPVTLGVMFGLVVGKFVGIGGACWLAVRLGFARLPPKVGWRHLLGTACLGGIGFTMSLFISNLAFTDDRLVEEAKLGILLGSLVAAMIGLVWLLIATRTKSAH